MTIKAVLRNGAIYPTEPLPPDWSDGHELVIHHPNDACTKDDFSACSREVDPAMAEVPLEDFDQFLLAVEEHRREAKEAMRRELAKP